MAGLVLVNPGSGPDDTALEDLRALFPGDEVQEVDPEDVGAQVRRALEAQRTFVGVAGGDGTVGAVAQHLVGETTPLVVVPAGTRNHFAGDLGIGSLDDAAAAAASGRTRAIDTGEVNGHVFVNNSSLGLYPKIVIRREVHERRLRKGPATVVAALQQLREADPVDVTIDGRTHRAWMVFVGNGVYGEGILDLSDRERLDGGLLDVRIVLADEPFARLRIVGALLLGRLARSRLLITMQTAAVTISVARAEVEVALDGEVERLTPPLAYRSVPGSLQVAVP